MGSNDLVFDLSPTQSAFVHSDAEIVQICGPMGEGKTTAGIVAIMAHAARCGRDIRGAIIRDTHINIKNTTVPDFVELLGDRVSVHDDCKKLIIHSKPKAELFLFGAGDEGALSKFQSLIVSFIMLEEPAPVMEKNNAGLSRDVFDMSVARASRQTGTLMRVQITQNPADEEHWTEDLFWEPEIFAKDPDTGVEIRKQCFRIPYGDNKFLNPHSRAANRAAFQKDPGKFARYVEGRAAPILRGIQVTPGYSRQAHWSDQELPVIPGALGIRFWDGWHNPRCVIGQFLPPGRIWFHDVAIGEGCGVDVLIKNSVIPLLESPKYKGKIDQWRDIGDPSMAIPDQSSRNKSAAKLIEKMLNTRFERGPSRWAQRIGPLQAALLSKCTDGSEKIQVSASAHHVHKSLNGGWHWKKDNNNKIMGSTPVKDEYSHTGDAVSHGVPVLLPQLENHGRQPASAAMRRRRQEESMQIAMSYGPGRGKTGGIG
ncbi:MAG: hypothetical protein ACOY4W_16790 [Thermodesulfobacteriota bacterium]